MLDLRRDLLARLVTSAHKDKILNKPFRVAHVEMPRERINIVMPAYPSSDFEDKVSSVRKEYSESSATRKSGMFPVSGIHAEKMEEKLDKVVTDNILVEVQVELEFAEELLKKIKVMDSDNPKIPIIEKTIRRLKKVLESKIGA